MTWTEERVTTLKRCAAEGKSFSDCAAELGVGFTRNMVAGKSSRMKVAFHGKPPLDAYRYQFTPETARAASRLRWGVRP